MLLPPEVYPVHIAARDGNHKLLRLLLRAGADPEQKTSKGAACCTSRNQDEWSTPWKINGWNPKSWRFGSDDFPFQLGVCFRFQPLIFGILILFAWPGS